MPVKYTFAILNTVLQLILIAWSSAASASPSASTLIDRGRYQEAISVCTQALKRKSKNGSSFYRLRGIAYGNLKQYQKSIADCSESIRLNATHASVYLTRAKSYSFLDEDQLARDDCSKAIILDPTFADAYFTRAVANARLKTYEQANSDFSQAIKLNYSDMDFAYGNRGLVLQRLGKYKDALEDYNRALSITPNSFWELYHRAGLNHALKNDADALNDSTKAIAAAPKNSDPYVLRGEIDQCLKLHRLAIANFDEALRLATNSSRCYRIHALRAESRVQTRDLKGAMLDYDEAVTQIHMQLSSIVPEKNKSKIIEFAQWLHTTRGWHRKESGDNLGALDDYTEAINLGSKDAMNYHERGFAHFDLQHFAEAISDANTGISLADKNKDSSWPHYFLRGRAQAAIGDNQSVIESFNNVISQLDWTVASAAHMHRSKAKFAVRNYVGGVSDFAASIACKYLGSFYFDIQIQMHKAHWIWPTFLERLTVNFIG